jgi:hypothetical protein
MLPRNAGASFGGAQNTRSVLECASPLALSGYASGKSGGGPPQSKTLARDTMIPEIREAFWSAPAPWRFQDMPLGKAVEGHRSPRRWRATR